MHFLCLSNKHVPSVFGVWPPTRPWTPCRRLDVRESFAEIRGTAVLSVTWIMMETNNPYVDWINKLWICMALSNIYVYIYIYYYQINMKDHESTCL